jgi:RNA polymerase sigma-70 factor (ECF subfamily)
MTARSSSDLVFGMQARVTERSVIERAASSDPQAIGEIYDRHHARIRRFARRLVGDAQAAEDLLQDVFVALPRALARFRGDSELGTFLMAIAAHRAKNHVRAAARRRRALERAAAEPARAGVASPEQIGVERELLQAVNRALDALPVAQRLAFVLCEVEGNDGEHAAAVLGVPVATVRTRLHHARRKLRAALARKGAL